MPGTLFILDCRSLVQTNSFKSCQLQASTDLIRSVGTLPTDGC